VGSSGHIPKTHYERVNSSLDESHRRVRHDTGGAIEGVLVKVNTEAIRYERRCLVDLNLIRDVTGGWAIRLDGRIDGHVILAVAVRVKCELHTFRHGEMEREEEV
jgi:hypothetical protein